MPKLRAMPTLVLPHEDLAEIGLAWVAGTTTPQKKAAGERIGRLCDRAVGKALAELLGGVPVVTVTNSNALLPPQANCVEVGPARVIGGIRPQNFDVAYRPDGVRFVYDSKTLNTRSSLSKNYQNMLNDLGTEASTVHTRFPSAVVAFIVAVPEPCLGNHGDNLNGVLRRLSGRMTTTAEVHKAEAIGLIVWDPTTGEVSADWPPAGSGLRIDQFSAAVERAYVDRYAGMPPHNRE